MNLRSKSFVGIIVPYACWLKSDYILGDTHYPQIEHGLKTYLCMGRHPSYRNNISKRRAIFQLWKITHFIPPREIIYNWVLQNNVLVLKCEHCVSDAWNVRNLYHSGEFWRRFKLPVFRKINRYIFQHHAIWTDLSSVGVAKILVFSRTLIAETYTLHVAPRNPKYVRLHVCASTYYHYTV